MRQTLAGAGSRWRSPPIFDRFAAEGLDRLSTDPLFPAALRACVAAAARLGHEVLLRQLIGCLEPSRSNWDVAVRPRTGTGFMWLAVARSAWGSGRRPTPISPRRSFSRSRSTRHSSSRTLVSGGPTCSYDEAIQRTEIEPDTSPKPPSSPRGVSASAASSAPAPRCLPRSAKPIADRTHSVRCSFDLGKEFNDVLGTWTRTRGITDRGCVLVRPDRSVARRSDHDTLDPAAALSAAMRQILDR